MAEVDPFGVATALAPAPGGPIVGKGVASGGSSEEDPATAFLGQQEGKIMGIENDQGFSNLDNGSVPTSLQGEPPGPPDAIDGVMNGKYYLGINGPTDTYAAISQVDRLHSETESICKWREEQMKHLEVLDANSQKQEAEWKEKAIKELEEWYARQDEELPKTKVNNRAAEEAFVNDVEETSPGREWELMARLCDFNPKSSKQAKDVSCMVLSPLLLQAGPPGLLKGNPMKHYDCNILISLSKAVQSLD